MSSPELPALTWTLVSLISQSQISFIHGISYTTYFVWLYKS
jgi:hypothetical protein